MIFASGIVDENGKLIGNLSETDLRVSKLKDHILFIMFLKNEEVIGIKKLNKLLFVLEEVVKFI